jgi:hypothetical protein
MEFLPDFIRNPNGAHRAFALPRRALSNRARFYCTLSDGDDLGFRMLLVEGLASATYSRAGLCVPHMEPLRAVAGVAVSAIDIATACLVAGVWTYTAIKWTFGDYPLRHEICMVYTLCTARSVVMGKSHNYGALIDYGSVSGEIPHSFQNIALNAAVRTRSLG